MLDAVVIAKYLPKNLLLGVFKAIGGGEKE
jgi:hypothetical protein